MTAFRVFAALLLLLVVGTLAFVVSLAFSASRKCESNGGVWVRPGYCVEVNR